MIKETKTHDAKIIADLKKRKLLKLQKVISFTIHKAEKFALEMVKEETDLTAEMLASGAWKEATFSECWQSCAHGLGGSQYCFLSEAGTRRTIRTARLTLWQSHTTSRHWVLINMLVPFTP